MAHNIDESTGKPAFVSYQQAAWHNLGTVKNTVLNLEDCLEEGGLKFHVDKLPNRHKLPSGKYVISEKSFFTFRADNEIVLGDKLGADYICFQNHEALAVVDDILKTGQAHIETAGSLDEGRRVFVCLKINGHIKIGQKDVVEQYMLVVISHDGRLAITVLLTNIRVVCQNTLSAALNGAKHLYKVRHTKNAMARTREAVELIGLSIDNRKHNEIAYNKMKATKIDKITFDDYIGNIFMQPQEIMELQKGNKDAVSTRKQNILNSVKDFAESGVGQKEALGKNLNMWYAYNAITGFVTSKEYASDDARFNNLVFGSSLDLITQAGNLALAPEKILATRPKSGIVQMPSGLIALN